MRLELLFVVAFLLYTVVIFKHIITTELTERMVWLFGAALTADISGTIFLCYMHAQTWVWNFHTTTGFISVIIMALHFSWALAARRNGGSVQTTFNHTSLAAWVIWFASFASGLPIW